MDSKWRKKRGEKREERLRKRREAYRARRDRESEEEWQTRLRHRYAAMNTKKRHNLTQCRNILLYIMKKEMVVHGSDGLSNQMPATFWSCSLGNTSILTRAKNPAYSNGSTLSLELPTHCIKSNVFNCSFCCIY